MPKEALLAAVLRVVNTARKCIHGSCGRVAVYNVVEGNVSFPYCLIHVPLNNRQVYPDLHGEAVNQLERTVAEMGED